MCPVNFHSIQCSRALIDACTTCSSSLAEKKRKARARKREKDAAEQRTDGDDGEVGQRSNVERDRKQRGKETTRTVWSLANTTTETRKKGSLLHSIPPFTANHLSLLLEHTVITCISVPFTHADTSVIHTLSMSLFCITSERAD